MLKPKQEQAISLLIQGQSITDISKDLNIVRSTIYEWLNNKKLDVELTKDDPDVTVAINLIKALPKEYSKSHDTSIEAVKNTASMDQYFNSFNV